MWVPSEVGGGVAGVLGPCQSEAKPPAIRLVGCECTVSFGKAKQIDKDLNKNRSNTAEN